MAKPDIALERFPVQVAAWRNEKEGRVYYSTKVSKRYKDPDTNEYKNTEYLAPADLLVAAELLREVWRLTSIEDKTKPRESSESSPPPDGAGAF